MKQKKSLAFLMALAMILTLCFGGLTAGAATVADATIDTGKTASLDVYKYDITSATNDGVWDGSYVSTGVRDEAGVESVLGSSSAPKTLPNGDTSYGYAVKGVEFTYLKVADIAQVSQNGTVQVLYGFDKTGSGESFLKAIGLSWEDRVAAADTATTYYFASETLIDGLSDSLSANATVVKNALETYVKGNGGTAMTETDAYGHTAAADLPLGLYVVVETKVPEYVTTPTTPFLVSLPMTSIDGTNATDGGTRWIYDVVAYPKNATGSPTLEKTVREAAADTGKSEAYAHTATGSDGDVMEYQILSTLPHITSTASYLTTYTYVDTLSKGLSHNKDVTIEWYTDAACTDLITTWTLADETPKYTVTYGDGSDGDSTMTVAMTEAGLAEINSAATVYTAADAVDSGYSACTMRIVYSATLHSDDSVVYGDGGNPNEVTLTWKRTSTNYFDTLTDCCHVYTYGIDLLKEFSDNKGDLTKVSFKVYNDTDGYYVVAELKDGIYYVTDHAEDEADATTFIPTEDGHIKVMGVEDDTYSYTELTTDTGYILNTTPVTVVITVGESDTFCDVCGAALLTATATKDGEVRAMEADNGSANAIVPFKVINHKQPLVPATGESGAWLISGGVALIALALMAFLFFAGKKKARSTN